MFSTPETSTAGAASGNWLDQINSTIGAVAGAYGSIKGAKADAKQATATANQTSKTPAWLPWVVGGVVVSVFGLVLVRVFKS